MTDKYEEKVRRCTALSATAMSMLNEELGVHIPCVRCGLDIFWISGLDYDTAEGAKEAAQQAIEYISRTTANVFRAYGFKHSDEWKSEDSEKALAPTLTPHQAIQMLGEDIHSIFTIDDFEYSMDGPAGSDDMGIFASHTSGKYSYATDCESHNDIDATTRWRRY